jgi:cytochrome c-type biogenesis protein CcmH/NrfG
MFKKVIGKTCRNPECELKDKLKEDFATMCDCGHALEDVTATDNKKVAIFSGVVILLLIGGGYFGIMKLEATAEKAGPGLVGNLISKMFGKGTPPTLPDVTPPSQTPPSNAPVTIPATEPKAAMQLVSDGLADAKNNNMQSALEKFKSAAEKDPSNAQAFGNLGAVYLALDKPDDALDASLKAVKLEPSNPIWHLNVAELYSKKGDKNDALAALEAAFSNGFKDTTKLKSFDFRNIQDDPKFKELVQRNRG